MNIIKIILLICLIACLIASNSSNSFALTRGEIRTQIRQSVGDNPATSNRWNDTILNTRINIVQNNIVRFTRCLYSQYATTTTAGQSEYKMSSGMIAIDRVSFISVIGSTVAYRKLEWSSMVGLDRDIPTWEGMAAGLPRYYYERGDKIGLYPAPSSSYSTSTIKSLKIDYYKKPDELTSDSHIPFDNDVSLIDYHDLIVLGVVIMCKKDDGKIGEVQVLQTEYWGLLTQMKDSIRDKPDKVMQLKVR